MSEIKRDDLLIKDGVGCGPLLATEIGEEVWIPVTPVRGDAFRAVKVEVKDRASVGGYEEKHAIEDWAGDAERLYDQTLPTDNTP